MSEKSHRELRDFYSGRFLPTVEMTWNVYDFHIVQSKKVEACFHFSISLNIKLKLPFFSCFKFFLDGIQMFLELFNIGIVAVFDVAQ